MLGELFVHVILLSKCNFKQTLRVIVEHALISPIVCEWKIHYVGNEVCMGCNPDGNLRGFPISG